MLSLGPVEVVGEARLRCLRVTEDLEVEASGLGVHLVEADAKLGVAERTLCAGDLYGSGDDEGGGVDERTDNNAD
jgi:hypothetical protein